MSVAYECWSLDAVPSNDGELIEGYHDGRAGDPEPGLNRDPAYRHGWYAGAADAGHIPTPEWLRCLARQMIHRARGAA